MLPLNIHVIDNALHNRWPTQLSYPYMKQLPVTILWRLNTIRW